MRILRVQSEYMYILNSQFVIKMFKYIVNNNDLRNTHIDTVKQNTINTLISICYCMHYVHIQCIYRLCINDSKERGNK